MPQLRLSPQCASRGGKQPTMVNMVRYTERCPQRCSSPSNDYVQTAPALGVLVPNPDALVKPSEMLKSNPKRRWPSHYQEQLQQENFCREKHWTNPGNARKNSGRPLNAGRKKKFSGTIFQANLSEFTLKTLKFSQTKCGNIGGIGEMKHILHILHLDDQCTGMKHRGRFLGVYRRKFWMDFLKICQEKSWMDP